MILRTEVATNKVTDYGVNKAVQKPTALRTRLAAINDEYLDIQQDILETFVADSSTISPNRPTPVRQNKLIPGLKVHDQRQLASKKRFAA